MRLRLSYSFFPFNVSNFIPAPFYIPTSLLVECRSPWLVLTVTVTKHFSCLHTVTGFSWLFYSIGSMTQTPTVPVSDAVSGPGFCTPPQRGTRVDHLHRCLPMDSSLQYGDSVGPRAPVKQRECVEAGGISERRLSHVPTPTQQPKFD